MENQEKNYNNEEKIDLRDYINVVLKRKWAIITIFLVIAIVSVIINLRLPQTFEAVTLVKLGQIKNQDALVNLENVADIKDIFSRKTILETIATKLNFPSTISQAKVAKMFSIEQGDGSSFLKIKGFGQTPQKAAEVSNLIAELLIQRHQNLFLEAEKTFNLEIKTIAANQEKIKKDIEQTKTEIIRLNNDVKFYTKEISERAEAQSEGQGRITEAYIQLLANTKNQKDQKEQQISDLEQQLISLNQNLQQKEYEKTYQVKSTTIEVPATPPDIRIAPKRTQNVAIAGILGLFISLLWAFGAEYFSKSKQA
ncbi:MAG: Wzz/FepE/Etk N-terminal domain-containing protein [Patescibacteria group bacterium]|nr:Wzz/FepE/Etk N-terminal domain-containing protein [Patescibacteria group bacterium]MDD5164193.1 Wzz/FepE/Etk N-terminal domain-containing protein [Patescibacteria group bacterium]MDD5534473.1 Wzz/FepE/Etk N-terminal domain-containing protein [Patescibacteria group bacterium]